MNTKTIMIGASIFSLFSGIAYTFLPDEILNSLNIEDTSLLKLLSQLAGAMYLAFASVFSILLFKNPVMESKQL